MDQCKIGAFIKELRRENGLTQEQMADRFGVSRRTVSRWETGRNLPDLDLLIEISNAFQVDLRELLEGERKAEKMNKQMEEAVLKVADYSCAEKEKMNQRMQIVFWIGLGVSVIYLILFFTGRINGVWGSFLGGFCQGASMGSMVVGILMTSRHAAKIHLFKRRLIQRIIQRKNQ